MLNIMRNMDWQRVQRRINSTLGRETRQVPLPGSRGKPRILYLIVAYPTFSESYMHEEILALSKDFDIKIVTYTKSERARRESFEYELIEYKAPCLVYAPFPKVNLDFTDPAQIAFMGEMDRVIADFQPDMIHAHYMGLGFLAAKLADRHKIPFTLRSHSMDVLNEPVAKLEAYCEAINSPWCKRVLAFPHSVARLTSHGMNPDLLVPCWPITNFDAFHRPEKRALTHRVMCAGPAIKKKVHKEFVDLAAQMRGSSKYKFDLYCYGPLYWDTRDYNKSLNYPVSMKYADPDDMPNVFPRYDWMVYPSHTKINKVGLPCGVAEAMAAGIGVCWQELPGRREEQLDFLGGAGFLVASMDEVPAIISQPYPEEQRQAGFEAARRFDIQGHKHLLSDVWNQVGVPARVLSAEPDLI